MLSLDRKEIGNSVNMNSTVFVIWVQLYNYRIVPVLVYSCFLGTGRRSGPVPQL
jgi:hypothetical protein